MNIVFNINIIIIIESYYLGNATVTKLYFASIFISTIYNKSDSFI